MNLLTKEKAERNLKLFYVYQAFLDPLFWGAIIIIFIQRVAGMSTADIFFMESVCVLLMIILEIPSGAASDLIGRKKTIIAGQIFLAIGIGLLAIATKPLDVWISNLSCFLGLSLIHGADTSLLKETLLFLNRGNDFNKFKGRTSSIGLILVAFSSLSAGYIAEVNLRLPIFLSLISFCLSIIAATFFTEPPLAYREKFSIKNHWKIMKLSVLFVANHQRVKWLIAFTLLIETSSKIWFFNYNPYFDLVGLPLHDFGVIFCIIGLVAAFFSFFSNRLEKKLGPESSILLFLLVIGLPILIMGTFVSKIAALLVIIQSFARGYFNPFFESFIHDYLDSQNRATVFSIKSTARGISDAIFLYIFSLVLRGVGLAAGLQILGTIVLGIGILLIIKYQRIFAKSKA